MTSGEIGFWYSARLSVRTSSSENRSTKECGWKDGDRGGLAQNKKTSLREEKEKST
jgi:hypothetical protein